jgi:PIN domain nuclease of toxin-antitoxin system
MVGVPAAVVKPTSAAQAQVEDLTIVTGDAAIAAYGISVLPN